MKSNPFCTFFKIGSVALFFAFLLTFNGCEETTTPDDSCTLTMNSFNVTPKTFAAGATLTGTVAITEGLNLDDFTIKSLTSFYLSSDNTFSSGDTELTAFVASNGLSVSGNQTTVSYDQIEIPFGVSDGNYFIIARIESRPCSDGDSTPVAVRSVSVTVN